MNPPVDHALQPLPTTGKTQRPLLNASLLAGEGGRRVERVVGLMGTEIRILVLEEDPLAAETAIAAAIAEMARLEAMMTDWRDDSQLMAINRDGFRRPVRVDQELFDVIRDGIQAGHDSDGAFDITWRSAGRLWDFKAWPPRLPDPAAIAQAVRRVDFRQVQLDPAARTVRLLAHDVHIGLGGIAKGAIVDHAVALLKRRGLRRFVVNAGGDIYANGRNDGGRLWWVAIRHPRDLVENLAVLPLANLAVVTSGDYERYITVDGRMYCHILDPRTGWPARGCQSVTVMAETTGRADALATAIFVLGPGQGLALAERLPQVEAMLVDADGGLHLTTGLQRGMRTPTKQI
ncbi:MAG: FAD:protein FMN transferase [Planctomycetes bacterium]|nr:FAD:protein FMN transferase [Planctomycetota bacterium]